MTKWLQFEFSLPLIFNSVMACVSLKELFTEQNDISNCFFNFWEGKRLVCVTNVSRKISFVQAWFIIKHFNSPVQLRTFWNAWVNNITFWKNIEEKRNLYTVDRAHTYFGDPEVEIYLDFMLEAEYLKYP